MSGASGEEIDKQRVAESATRDFAGGFIDGEAARSLLKEPNWLPGAVRAMSGLGGVGAVLVDDRLPSGALIQTSPAASKATLGSGSANWVKTGDLGVVLAEGRRRRR